MNLHVLVCALAVVSPAVSGKAQYLAYDLGPGSANAINNYRTVVGFTTRSGPQLAFSYSAGVMTTLGVLPGADFSIAYDISDSGDISGTSGGDSFPGILQGFHYRSGVMTGIATLGSHTYAGAINNAGTIVGESTVPNGQSHAFSYTNGVITDLGTLGGRFSRASSINSAGVIVGDADLPQFTHAFRYENGTMTDLGSLDGRMSYAADINDAGSIVGYSTIGGETSGYEHAFLYEHGLMTDLGTLALGSSASSEANALNSSGVIVGGSDAWDGAAWTRHAFIYRNGEMTDLAPYLATVGLGGLSIAEDINDQGDIVGFALDSYGMGHGFLLLVPEPSPTTLVLAGVILSGLSRRTRPNA